MTYKEPGDYFSVNYSDYRPETTFVFGHGNNKTGLKDNYSLEDGTQIFNNTNIRNHYSLSKFDDIYATYGKKGTVSDGPTTVTYYTTYSTSM